MVGRSPSITTVQISTAAIARIPGVSGLQENYFLWTGFRNRHSFLACWVAAEAIRIREADKWKKKLRLLTMDLRSSLIVPPNAASADYADGWSAFWIGTAASS
jgi:hypothetical protein